MRPITSVRLSGQQQTQLQSPLKTALIAARVGTFDSDHYHTLAAAFQITQRLAEIVPRHRQLVPEFRPCLDALNAVFARSQHGDWSIAEGEMEEIEAGVQIYESLLLTSTSKHIRKALEQTRKDFQEEA